MQKYHRVFAALVTTVALLAAPSVPAQEAKSKAATKAEAKTKADAKSEAAAKGKDLYPQSYFDFMLKQRTAQGQPDSPELRTAVQSRRRFRVWTKQRRPLSRDLPAALQETGPQKSTTSWTPRSPNRSPAMSPGGGSSPGRRSRSRVWRLCSVSSFSGARPDTQRISTTARSIC